MAKARGFTISIEKMSDKDRSGHPSGKFAEDYNRLHAAVLDTLPELQPLMPPTLETYEDMSGRMMADSSYNELDSYCEQIYQLLSDSAAAG